MNFYSIMTICLTTFLLLGIACQTNISHDNLIGTYAIKKDGEKAVIGKIEKREDGYYFIEKNRNGEWQQAKKTTEIPREEVEELIDTTITAQFAGLKAGNAAILKMPAGWNMDGFKTETGFWTYFPMRGPVELHPQ